MQHRVYCSAAYIVLNCNIKHNAVSTALQCGSVKITIFTIQSRVQDQNWPHPSHHDLGEKLGNGLKNVHVSNN